ncbi:hypothetical protein AVEN_60096-1 [Araneus ventricosus]|uniref:Uncharacterized protein n=1 Tax=Araneus ventricosus TaxID=182803 RepID=A0A4Y2J8W7_ARAVE|nr:hypothetical protein AVEN_60096-1 [Araneus ventricosus]
MDVNSLHNGFSFMTPTFSSASYLPYTKYLSRRIHWRKSGHFVAPDTSAEVLSLKSELSARNPDVWYPYSKSKACKLGHHQNNRFRKRLLRNIAKGQLRVHQNRGSKSNAC